MSSAANEQMKRYQFPWMIDWPQANHCFHISSFMKGAQDYTIYTCMAPTRSEDPSNADKQWLVVHRCVPTAFEVLNLHVLVSRTALQLLASLDAKSLRHWTDLGMEGGATTLHTLSHKPSCHTILPFWKHNPIWKNHSRKRGLTFGWSHIEFDPIRCILPEMLKYTVMWLHWLKVS